MLFTRGRRPEILNPTGRSETDGIAFMTRSRLADGKHAAPMRPLNK